MKKDLLFLLWSGVFVVIVWVIFSILHSFTSTTISPAVMQQIAPIKSTFDVKTISAIKARDKVIPQYTSQNATASASPTPYQITGLIIPIASPSSATATTGGTQK